MTGIGHNGGPAIDEEDVSFDHNGWIAVARGLRDHWLVGFGKPVAPVDPDRGSYSRTEAWLDLIMECQYKAGTVNNGGRKMRLERGQLLGAVSWLANRWNWTPKTVRGFLDKLEDEGMITRFAPGVEGSPDGSLNGIQKGKQRGKQASILTICKYALYQLGDKAEGQANGQEKGTQGASKGLAEGNIYKEETKEQGNNDLFLSEPSSDPKPKKAKRRIVYPPEFELFWQRYPDTTNNSKLKALEAWSDLSPDDRQAALHSLPVFTAYCRARPDYRCVHAERYLKYRRWEGHQPKTNGHATHLADPIEIEVQSTLHSETGRHLVAQMGRDAAVQKIRLMLQQRRSAPHVA